MHQRGFSTLELLVALSLCGILSLIGVPSITRMTGQLRAADDARRCALTLIAARDEAVRLRADVTVTLSSTGLSVDLYDDDTIEYTLDLDPSSTWDSSVETTITFNGLGLARGLGSATTLAIKNRGVRTSLTVNQNGTVTL